MVRKNQKRNWKSRYSSTGKQVNEREKKLGYAHFKKAVFKRDGHRCVICKKTRRIEAHHIIRYSDSTNLQMNPDNGVTLCNQCHYMIRNKEHCWIDYFRAIVIKHNER